MSASEAAKERVRRALAHIQNAQAELGRAHSELSTLRGGFAEYRKAGKLYDAVHALWYRVRAIPEKRGTVTTDSEPEAELTRGIR